MKTNTKKKIIVASAILALLTIGGGELYSYSQHTTTNAQPGFTGTNSGDAQTNAAAGESVISPTDNSNAVSSEGSRNLGVSSGSKHQHSSEHTSANDDQAQTNDNVYALAPAPSAPPAKVIPVAPVVAPKQRAIYTGATSIKPGSINFAPELGINLNGLYKNSTSNLLSNGFHLGIMMNVALGNRFALQPGIMYIMKGNEDKSTGADGALYTNTTHTTKLNYLEVPMNVVYKFGDIKGAPRFMVGAGPYVSYLVSSVSKFQTTSENGEGFTVSNNSYTSRSGMQKLDAGIGGFVGCQMPMGFYAKAGAELGLTNVQQATTGINASDRNYNFLLSVGHIIGSKNTIY